MANSTSLPPKCGPTPERFHCVTRLLLTVVLAGGCSHGDTDIPLPAPESVAPVPSTRGLRAGFGRADITPAPGFPLAGNALEGAQSTGYRHRLYARTMVLEDADGERYALIVADLGHLSSNLHRLTAERVRATTGIGADRLLISVTHTHAGPGSHYGVRSYNEQSAAFPGYDPNMVEFLVARFTASIHTAFEDLQPAVAAWDTIVVPAAEGLTRNRSFDAFLRNPEPRLTEIVPELPGETPETARLRQRQEAVDRVWRLLRVDQCNADRSECHPRGAYSIYAIHGTGNPPSNTLIDGDIHALVERGLERHIESLSGGRLASSSPEDCSLRPPEDGMVNVPADDCIFSSRAFHLFANGTEGDVSPNHESGTRCGPEEEDKRVAGGDAALQLRVVRRPRGPRTPPAPEEWRRTGPRDVADCLGRANASVARLGDALTTHAIRAFTSAGTRLTADVSIQRAFASYDLQDAFGDPAVCPEPRTGTANFGGAEDGRTRMYKWRFFFLFPAGLEEGRAAIDPRDSGCFGAKLIALGPLQGLIVGRGGLPRYAQFSVVRIGNGLIGTVPAEVTTEAGMRLKAGMREVRPEGVELVGIVGLANGYMQYVTTAEEYTLQSYEGGSNLYGPNTAAAMADELRQLTASLELSEPIVEVGPIVATPGDTSQVMYPRSEGPRVADILRRITDLSCTGAAFHATWIDAYPGLFVPADGPVLEIQRGVSGGWQPVAWDDDRAVAVQAIGPRETGYAWSVSWQPETILPGTYRMTLFERDIQGQGHFEPLPRPGVTVPTVECG